MTDRDKQGHPPVEHPLHRLERLAIEYARATQRSRNADLRATRYSDHRAARAELLAAEARAHKIDCAELLIAAARAFCNWDGRWPLTEIDETRSTDEPGDR